MAYTLNDAALTTVTGDFAGNDHFGLDGTTNGPRKVLCSRFVLNDKSYADPSWITSLAASKVGLGSVENKSSATIRGEITSLNVTTALGFSPYNASNPSGYITSAALSPYLTSATAASTYQTALVSGTSIKTINGNSVLGSGDITITASSVTNAAVISALGFTPYNATNPSGFTSNTGTVTSVAGTGTVSGLTLSGTVTASGNLTLGGTLSLTSGNVTTALGYTPYNSSNPSGYITSSGSISGNAATATSSPLLSALANYVWSASTTPTGFNQGIQASFVQAGNGFPNYGSLINVNTYSGGGGALQMYVPYGPGYGGIGMQVRFGNYEVASGNSWTSWKTLLASDNYTSYAPSLTGSGASGTWGISVTGSSTSCSGNAATASSISGFNNPTTGATANTIVYRDGSGHLSGNYLFGNYVNSGDDVSGGTVTYVMAKFGDNYYRSATAAKVATFLNGTAMVPYSVQGSGNVGGTGSASWHPSGIYSAGFNWLYGGINAGGSSVTNMSDARANIFYDYNDTTYYADPASTSWLRHLSVGDVNAANDGSWNARLNLTGSSHARLDVKSNSDGIITSLYSHVGYGSGRVGTMSNHPLAFVVNGGIAGYAYTNYLQGVDSVRAPIFYDSGNTGYYVDPASDANIAGYVYSGNSYTYGWFRNQGDQGLYNSSYGNHFYATSSAYWNIAGNSGSEVGLLMRTGGHQGTTRGYLYGDSSNNFGLLGSTGGWRLKIVENDWVLINGSSIRAPIFYDNNDTSYFVDGNSSSTLRTITNRGWLYINEDYGHSVVGVYASTRLQGVFAMGDSYKLPASGIGGGSLYGIAWSHPNAGGVAGNLNTHGALLLENGGYLCALSGSIRCRDDMRTPIYYDSNDTAYYIDPNSDSNWQGLTQRGKAQTGLTGRSNWRRPVQTGDQSYWGGQMGWGQENLDTVFEWGTGFWDTWGSPANQPSGTSHWTGINCQHHISYGWQMGNGAGEPTLTFIRGKWGGGWSGWLKLALYDTNTNTNRPFYAQQFIDAENTGYYCDPNNTSRMNAVVADNLYAYGTVTAYYSDDRLKTRFSNIVGALDKVCSLNGFFYEANEVAEKLGYKKKREVGLSAQEVQRILPEIISPAPIDETYMTIQYDRVVPLLVEAIKELRLELNQLKSSLVKI